MKNIESFAPQTMPWGQCTNYIAGPKGSLIEIHPFTKGRFYKFNLSLANSQNLIKATANVILLSQI